MTMTRIACGLALIAFATLLHLIALPGGPSASIYFFIGSPCLAVAIVLYLIENRQELREALVHQLTLSSGSPAAPGASEGRPTAEGD